MTVADKKTCAKDVMTTHVVTVHQDELVRDALELMMGNGVSWLPVVNRHGQCVGVISQADLLGMAYEAEEEGQEFSRDNSWISVLFSGARLSDVTEERIADTMSQEVVTVRPNDSIRRIAEIMLQEQVHHVPVCDEDRKLLGVISTMDILRLVSTSSSS